MYGGKRSLSVDRAFEILTVIGAVGPPGLTLTELAGETNLGISTAHRYVSTLLDWCALKKDDAGRLRLGTGLISLARDSLLNDDLVIDAHARLTELAHSLGETLHLAVLSDGRLVCADKVVGDRSVHLSSRVGDGVSMAHSALGKSVLAQMPDEGAEQIVSSVRRGRTPKSLVGEDLYDDLARVESLGWALDDEENELSVRCVGAAISSRQDVNTVYGSVSVSGPASRLSFAKCDSLAPRILDLATDLARMCDERQSA